MGTWESTKTGPSGRARGSESTREEKVVEERSVTVILLLATKTEMATRADAPADARLEE